MIVLRINWNVSLGRRAKDDRRTRLWWQRRRWDLFRRYTLPSLQAQSCGDWQAWLRCDPELSRLTEPMARVLERTEPRCRVVYDTPAAAAELAAARPDPLIFGRLDSDDLLHPQALARWSAESPGLVQFGFGYALDHATGRLFEWNHPSAPFIARVGDWRMLHKGLPHLGGNHGRAHRIARRIDDGRWYMVVLHGGNLCNVLRAPWLGPQLIDEHRSAVLAEFGMTTRPGADGVGSKCE